MQQRLLLMRDEIEDELTGITLLMRSLEKAKAQSLDAEIKKRVIASILADFYMAVEKILKIIAKDIDLNLPEGEDWHQKILRQAAVALPDIRPRVIEKELFQRLQEYLKFRHLVRNIYGFQLKYERFEHLAEELPDVADALNKQVQSFFLKMQEVADSIQLNEQE